MEKYISCILVGLMQIMAPSTIRFISCYFLLVNDRLYSPSGCWSNHSSTDCTIFNAVYLSPYITRTNVWANVKTSIFIQENVSVQNCKFALMKFLSYLTTDFLLNVQGEELNYMSSASNKVWKTLAKCFWWKSLDTKGFTTWLMSSLQLPFLFQVIILGKPEIFERVTIKRLLTYVLITLFWSYLDNGSETWIMFFVG